jgi:hypothetical protein
MAAEPVVDPDRPHADRELAELQKLRQQELERK